EGEVPDSARAFLRQLQDLLPRLALLRYGLLALGDHGSHDSYSRFGRYCYHQLHDAVAQPLLDRVEVDDNDPAAMRHWQHHLGQLSGNTDAPDWRAPDYRRWRLVERRLLNPGSVGGPAFHLALQPEDAADLQWQAGDVAEIGPRHS